MFDSFRHGVSSFRHTDAYSRDIVLRVRLASSTPRFLKEVNSLVSSTCHFDSSVNLRSSTRRFRSSTLHWPRQFFVCLFAISLWHFIVLMWHFRSFRLVHSATDQAKQLDPQQKHLGGGGLGFEESCSKSRAGVYFEQQILAFVARFSSNSQLVAQ